MILYKSRGFTLMEMIITMTIIGIVAAMVAVFIRPAIDAYFASSRRASLTEEADLALRRMVSDLQAALPNSYSCTNNTSGPDTLSFLAIKSAGRYREYADKDGNGIPLLFDVAGVTSFNTIGVASNGLPTIDNHGRPVTSGSVCVGNLSSGVPVCNSTATPPLKANCAALTAAVTGTTVSFSANKFPEECNLQSATIPDDPATAARNEINERVFGRFYIVDNNPVTYRIASGQGLLRVSGAASPVLARNATSLEIACEDGNERVQTISLQLTVEAAGEKVEMLRQTHVMNLP